MRKFLTILLLLATMFPFAAKAEQLTVCDGSDGNSFVPFYSEYADAYLRSQMVYPASMLADMAGTPISGMKFYANQQSVNWTGIFQVYMAEYPETTISGFIDPTTATTVYTGTLAIDGGEMVVTFIEPFNYAGGNLLIGFDEILPGEWADITWEGQTTTGTAVGYYSYNSVGNVLPNVHNFLPKVTFDYVVPPVPFSVTSTDFGYRPNNAWMEPATVEVLGTGYNVTAMNIDNDYFTFDGPAVPFTTPATFAVTTGNAATGDVTGHVAFFYEGSRGNARFDLKATAYDPTEGDVVEKAKIVEAGFSTYSDRPSEIYHNYNLPGEDSDNPDAVYRLNFYNLPKDVLLKANIVGGDRGEGKVALYKEEADGTCHPMRDNAYEYAGMFEGKTLDGNGMYVEKGGIYYLVAQAADRFTVNINALEAPAPGKPVVTYPTPASLISPDNVTAKWNISEFTTEIRVLLHSEYENGWNFIKNWTPCITETDTLNEVQLSNLEEGTEYYLRVDAKNAAGEVESDVVTFYTTASAPTDFSVNKDEIFEGDEVTFSWDYTTSSDVTGYNIYCDANKLNPSVITTKYFNYTFGPSTYNIVPGYEITVKAVFSNGTESAASEPISVKVSGRANFVGGTVYYDIADPKTLAGATVTFAGTDEFGNDVSLTATSGANGAYAFVSGPTDNRLKAGTYTATAVLSGLSYSAEITGSIDVAHNGIINDNNFTADMALPVPTNFNANKVNVFDGDTVTFSWDYTTSSQLFVGYNLYINDSKINQDPIQDESIPCQFDGYNMIGYEIMVKAAYKNGGFEYESAASEPISVKVSGYGSAFGLVNDCDNMTPLVGVELTLNGLDEFGDTVVFTTTTDDVGVFEEDGIKVGTYTVTASLNGFEDVTMEEPITINYNVDTPLDDICMHEKYYAPSKVTADTIDDNKVVRVKWDMRSLQSFNIYVRQIAGEDIEPGVPVVELLEEGYNAVSSTWYDNLWETRERGVYQYGVEANYEANQNPPRGTSEITWSNTLEKDMYMKPFTFKASTNDVESVEGAHVTMTNVSEPEAEIAYGFDMDATGEYQIVDFRRGVYNIEVEPAEGDDHDAVTKVNVDLWDASEYSVELKETELEVKNVYVSHTGFARWDKPTVKDRGFNGYYLYVDDVFVKETADTCYQILNLTEGEHKFTVGVVQNTGETTQADKEFEYLGCDNFDPALVAGYHAPQAVAECQDVVVTWGEEGSTPEGSSIFSCDFEDNFVATYDSYGWVSIDKDGDGEDWITGTEQDGVFNGYNYSIGLVSKSYNYDALAGIGSDLDADNYLLSPEVELPANGTVTLSWYAMTTGGENWPDYYEVMIAPNASTDTSDFVSVFSEDGPTDWAQRTVDISAYAGTTVRVVFHHKDYAQYWIVIDNLDITSTPAEWDVTTWALYLDGELRECVSKNIMHREMTIEDTKKHTFRVVGIDAEYNMSCGDTVTFTAGKTTKPENLAATEENNGIKLTWEGNSSEYIVYKGFTKDNMILLGMVEDGTTEFVDEVVMSGCLYGVSGLSDCGESEMDTVKFGALEDPHYTPEDQYFSATMDVTGYVAIDNVEPLFNSNLEIGAFITDIYGVRHCCGSARSIYAPSENHNIFQFKVYGDTENDVITFELYDHSTGEVLDYLISKSTLNFAAGGEIGSVPDPFIFKFFSTETHTVHLKGIGNWVSTYIELSGEEGLGIIEDGLGENAVEIKVDNKFTTYVEDYGWWGTLETADSRNMFIIRMSNEADVAFTGMVADPADHPITIHKNWNRIGYISKEAMDVNTALGTLNPAEGDQIKCKEIFSQYYEGYGWFGDINTMEPDKGYMYYSNSEEPDTLVYPVAAPSRVENAAGNATSADSHWTVEPSRFAMNMSVTAAVTVDGSLVENGDIEVGAFCNGEVRGSARPVYVEPLDRYVIFLTVFGNEGDNISFRLFNAEDGSEYTAVEHLVYSDDAIKGGIKDPFMLNFGDDNISVFPNPTKGNVVISADGMRNISVVNTLGQTVYRQAANAGEMTIDMSQFGAGMYLISIETENGTTVKRVTVTR